MDFLELSRALGGRLKQESDQELDYQRLNCSDFVGTPSDSFVDQATKQKMLTIVNMMRNIGMF